MRLALLRRGGRPLFLWLGSILFILIACLGLLTWGLIVFDQAKYPGRGVTQVAGLTIVGVRQHLAMTPLIVVIVGAQIVVAYGLLAGRGWARPFAVLYWPVAGLTLAVLQIIGGASWGGVVTYLLEALGVCAIAWWYLYRFAHARRYYDEGAGGATRAAPRGNDRDPWSAGARKNRSGGAGNLKRARLRAERDR
ncbi:MAG: hypothetical protein LJF04_18115 [Gemmatimonadetes bacterium]|nr:hypothetical protein [Gemmatimonadota bacterium]